MAEDNLINAGSGSDAPVNPSTGGNAASSKKPKTEQQKAKERERRKRRRRKKKQEPQFVAGQDVATTRIIEPPEANIVIPENTYPEQNISPGAAEIEASAVDAPLMLSEKDENAEIRDEALASSRPFNEGEVNAADSAGMPPESKYLPDSATDTEMKDLGYDNSLYSRGEPLPPEQEAPVFVETPVENEPEPFAANDNVQPVEDVVDTVVEPVVESEPESPVESIVEESTVESVPEVAPLDVDQQVFEEAPKIEPVDPEIHEVHQETEYQKQARELSENLLKDEDSSLDELPVKQGVLGKVFDQIVGFINGRKKVKETVVNTAEPAKSTFDISKVLGILKYMVGIVVIVILAIGAFWLGSSLKLLENVGSWFTPKPGQELVIGDNSKVILDSGAQRKWGFFSIARFGENMGDKRDLGFNVFFNANYFGKLKDPVFYGQTGISAAIYYGFGKDDSYQKNRFIYYVNYLKRVAYANQVKVEDVLNNKPRRDDALDSYTTEIKILFEEGNKLRKEINVQIDEFKIALNSLNSEKDRYETDFFASLNEMEGEKADLLLVKFVEISQKQLEVKAKLAALTQLSKNYETLLIKLKLRIEGVEKNRDALISGVTVIDIPGSDVDLTRN